MLRLTAAGRLHWHPDYGAMLEINGEMFLVEKFSIATASLGAKMGVGNTWIWFEGTAKWDMIVFSAKGTVHGEIGDPTGKSPGHWSLSGGVDVCVEFVDICAGGKVAASAKGVAGCLYLDLDYTGIAAGGVYYWNGNWSTFWGCSKEKVKSKVVALDLAASSAGAAQTISIPAGMRSYLVKVTGVGGAPGVVLVGPTGRRSVTPGPDKPKTDRKSGSRSRSPAKARPTSISGGRSRVCGGSSSFRAPSRCAASGCRAAAGPDRHRLGCRLG